MKKNLFISIIVGIVILLGINIFILLKNPVDSKNDTNGFIVFRGTNGASNTVNTRDFRNDSDVVAVDEVTYQIDEGVTNNEVSFQIYFDDIDKSFTVSLLQEPLRSSRINAEQALLKRLDVQKNDLCNMNIIVNTPSFVSEEYSGNNLGLSFCPGAVAL